MLLLAYVKDGDLISLVTQEFEVNSIVNGTTQTHTFPGAISEWDPVEETGPRTKRCRLSASQKEDEVPDIDTLKALINKYS